MTSDLGRHVGILAVLYTIIGVLSILGGVVIAVVGVMGGFSVLASGEIGGGLGVSSVALFVGVAVAAGGVPELVLAYGLRQRASWARWLGIVFSVMGLPVAPIGTALGLYGLWVLMSDAGLREFGAQRSWLTDGSAVLVGWVFREGRGSRRRDSPAAGGLGCFVIICVIVAIAVMRGGCEIVVRPVSDGGNRGPSTKTATRDAGSQTSTGSDSSTAGPVEPIGVVDGVDASAPGDDTAEPPPRSPEVPSPPAQAKRMLIYEDEAGTVHIVDELEKIPPRYRSGARVAED